MKEGESERKRRDWLLILLILPLGMACMFVSGQFALGLIPHTSIDASMGSNLDPNVDFLTSQTFGLVGPISQDILTPPFWLNTYLTPQAFRPNPPVSPLPTNQLQTPPTSAVPVLPTTSLAAPTSLPTFASNPTPYLPPATQPGSGGGSNKPPTKTPQPSADLSITVDDGVSNYSVGGTLVYTVIVHNNGSNAVTDALVTGNKPAAITSWTWSCIAQTGGASGCTPITNSVSAFNDSVSLPNGSSLEYRVTAQVSSTATGTLVNTVSIAVPVGYTDPVSSNNSASDSDAPPASTADLSIFKTDGSSTYTPGVALTYTITVDNAGPSDVTGATVNDTFPATLTNVTWTCVATGGASCTANGAGSLNETVNLPAGSKLTYTVSTIVSAGASGNLSNTATVTVPAGIVDLNSANNSSSDIDVPPATLAADLSVTKTDGVTSYTPGGTLTYTITVSNSGPSDANGATVTDTFPAVLTNPNWICATAGGAACTLTGSGNINDVVNLPAGASVIYTVTSNISSGATGNLSNTASVSVPVGVTDSNLGNNSATDVDSVAPSADLSITKDDGVIKYTPGGSVTYTIQVLNSGPSNVTGATVTDNFPAIVTSATWTCTKSGSASCTASGSGNINDSVNLVAGASITYNVVASINGSATGNLVNVATVSVPAGVTDPVPGNNSASDLDVNSTALPTCNTYVDVASTGTFNLAAGIVTCLRFTNAALSPDAAVSIIGHPNMYAQWYGRGENGSGSCGVQEKVFANASETLSNIGIKRNGDIILYITASAAANVDVTSIASSDTTCP